MKLARSLSVLTLLSVGSGALAAVPVRGGTSVRPPKTVVLKVTAEEAARAEASIKAPKLATSGAPVPSANGTSLTPVVPPDLGSPSPPQNPKLHVGRFQARIHAALKDETRGYALGLRKGGEPILSLMWDTARSRLNGNRLWTLDTRMHVGEVSEVITAITMAKMLEERGISLDAPIVGYLPSYWTVGPNNQSVTFRELIMHTSGIECAFSDFDAARAAFTRYAGHRYASNWSPANYGLLRVLSGTVTGAVNKDTWFVPPIPINRVTDNAFNDAMWNVKSTDAFLSYAQAKVFTPSGVKNVSTVPSASSALAYPGKWEDSPGWNSGDLKRWLGPLGFRLSVNEVLDVMSTYRRKGTILTAARAKQLIEAGYGLDKAIDTPAGKIHLQYSVFSNGEGSVTAAEQAAIMFLPDDMELVVFVNSRFFPNPARLDAVVANAYVASLQ